MMCCLPNWIALWWRSQARLPSTVSVTMTTSCEENNGKHQGKQIQRIYEKSEWKIRAWSSSVLWLIHRAGFSVINDFIFQVIFRFIWLEWWNPCIRSQISLVMLTWRCACADRPGTCQRALFAGDGTFPCSFPRMTLLAHCHSRKWKWKTPFPAFGGRREAVEWCWHEMGDVYGGGRGRLA